VNTVALINGRVLTDEGFLDGRAVLLEGKRILDVVAANDARVGNARTHDLAGGLLLPGFIDSQVNGGGGLLFNDTPDVATIEAIGRAHRRFGTTSFLPTLISDDLSVVAAAIAAVDAAIAAGVPGVEGIHIEGPFISQARKGAHDSAHIRALGKEHVALLSSLRHGRTLVTLAPERASLDTIARLRDAGVVIAAGHSNASYADIVEALGHGVRGFTHLFNAMSPLQSREPGVVGAALHDQESWCAIIVDGWHVHPVTLQVGLASKRHDRFMLVTDAMPNVGTELTSFQLQGRHIEVVGGRCVDELGTLSGSALDMASAVRNAIELLGLPVETAIRMASTYPAEFLGLGDQLGRIAPGYRANLVLADAALRVRDTWIDGARSGIIAVDERQPPPR
jgi:N-acetylglucosamine-6-phosphate deacetylase